MISACAFKLYVLLFTVCYRELSAQVHRSSDEDSPVEQSEHIPMQRPHSRLAGTIPRATSVPVQAGNSGPASYDPPPAGQCSCLPLPARLFHFRIVRFICCPTCAGVLHLCWYVVGGMTSLCTNLEIEALRWVCHTTMYITCRWLQSR